MQYIQEEIWLQQLSTGVDAAYKQLFDRYYGLLAMFAYKYLEDRQAAEDVIHDVLLHLYQNKEKFTSIVVLKSYLYNAVRNRCLNILQHRKIVKDYALNVTEQRAQERGDYTMLEIEVYDQLRDAIDALPVPQCIIYDLTLQGYDNKEIAEKLGITEDSVKAHKKRGKKLLRERLENLMFWAIILSYM